MTNYFRITGYCKEDDFCFIMDSFGCFEKLWQFSAFLVSKGLQVLEVSNAEKFIDVNISRVAQETPQLILRAKAKGKPDYISQAINGINYKAVKVEDKIYVPDNTVII